MPRMNLLKTRRFPRKHIVGRIAGDGEQARADAEREREKERRGRSAPYTYPLYVAASSPESPIPGPAGTHIRLL